MSTVEPMPLPNPAPHATAHAATAHDLTPGLQHTYASQLPELCVAWLPARVPQSALVVFNHALAHELGWPAAALDSPLGAALLAGNTVPDGAQPVAQGYAGHQFGGYSPQLGDGRALLLGEVLDRTGQLRDVAFKGSGRTPFSRGGDGKATLSAMLREYLISEAMHALGVPTTRSLAVATTGERIRRDPGPQPGAVLTRVAASHIRVGTFQWVAGQGDEAMLRRLADFTLARHFPGLVAAAGLDTQGPTPGTTYLGLLSAVAERQAALVAGWMGVGFIHGVMNTDNMALSGETIDYGPCAFMEAHDPATVFSSIDHGGRYAWGNQPGIARWNLARLAEALLPLLHTDVDQAVALATEVIDQFPAQYQRHWLATMRAKLGLVVGDVPHNAAATTAATTPATATTDDATDLALIHDWLTALQNQAADWTLAHRQLCDLVEATTHSPALSAWLPRWQARLQRNPSGGPADWAAAMRRVNPLYIPRNHRVEEALSAASERGDMGPFHALLAVVQHPFDEVPGQEGHAQPAPPEQVRGYRTFCGT